MRFLVRLFIPSLLMLSSSLSAGEKATVPAPRTVDYEWMSAATWQQKHEANVLRATAGDADILLIGDSITEGWQNTTLWGDHFPKLKIANLGIGGDTTANVLWRLDHGELGNFKPRVIVLLIGINNLGRNGDKPAELALGIRSIAGMLNARLPTARLLVLGVLPSDQAPKTVLRKKIKKTNQLVKELADGHSVYFADLGDAMLEPDGSIAKETMADFLHPTSAGYARFAAVLFPQVERLLQRN